MMIKEESDSIIISTLQIESRIFTIRNLQVMVDRDLAELYQVETKVLNQAVKRNSERFPESFRFQLFDEEKSKLVTNCDRLEVIKHSASNPYVFTEQGVAMLSAVLRSSVAIEVSIQIIKAFVELRKYIANNAEIFNRLDKIEKKLFKTDEKFDKLFEALERKELKPEKGIFFDGQIFDAFVFASDIIRSAKQSICLIDNYIDDTVLTLLCKRQDNVSATVYTKTISKRLKLDLDKHNAQYPFVEIRILKEAHDRFIIIDSS